MSIKIVQSIFFGVFFIAACASSPERPDSQPGTRPVDTGVGSGTRSAATEGGGQTKLYDLNHDNKPDVWAYYQTMEDPDHPGQRKETLARKEWDCNFDGRIDIRVFFNFRGEKSKEEMDLDFDGHFDVAVFYQKGKKVRQEYDFNFDGKPDYWKFYENAKLVRTERDRDFNGRVDQWEYYQEDRLDRIGKDEDGDGQIDQWIKQEE